MSVSLVGTPGIAHGASPVTGSYGQTPTANNLLVAVVTWWSTAIETFNPTASSGWARLIPAAVGNNPSGTSHAGVDVWWKKAAGGDAAPVFTQASGATSLMTCVIREYAGANTTSPLDTSGVYQSGATALTSPPAMSATTGAAVAAAGEAAVSAMVQDNQANGTQTWTETGAGWTSDYFDGATSQSGHSQHNSQLGPSSGSALTDAGHYSTGTANVFAAGLVAVIAVGPVSHTATASLTVTPGFTAHRSHGFRRTASLTVTPAFTAHGSPSGAPHTRTAALTVTPGFTAHARRGKRRSASLTVSPSFLVAFTGGANAVFPFIPLGVHAAVYLGAWTEASQYIYQRDPVSIRRGRQGQSVTMSPSQMTMTLDNRDARWTIRNPVGAWYGQLVQNTPFRLSVPGSLAGLPTYLRIEDDSTSRGLLANSSAVQITGSIDIRIDVALSGYQSCVLAAKWFDVGNERSWALLLNNDGTLNFLWSPDGTLTNAGGGVSTLPIPLGRNVLRVTLNTSTEAVTFYTAPAGGINGTGFVQLGDTVDGGGSTSIFGGTAGITVGYALGTDDDFGVNGMTGAVFDFQIQSGIGGTIEAHMATGGFAAGATTWTDSHSQSWSVTGTAELSSRLYRFHGELSSLPKAADPSGVDVYSQATVSGIMQRLQQQENPTNSAMYRAYVRLAGPTAPVAYWAGEDGTNATSIGAAIGDTPMAISGTPQLFTNSDFLCSDSLPVMNGATFSGSVSAPGVTWTDNVIRFLLEVPSGGDTNNAVIGRAYTLGTVRRVDLVYGNTGSLELNGYDINGAQLFTTGAVAFAVNGELLRVSFALRTSGSNVEYEIQTLLPGNSTGEGFSGTLTSAKIGAVTAVQFGGGVTDTVMGHFSVQPVWDSLFDLASALDAWQRETAGNRFTRLAGEEGYNCRIVGYPDVSTAMGPQTLETIADLLQECETTDQGMMFEPRQVLGLGYVTRASLYNQPVTTTASYSSNHLAGNPQFAPTSDDQSTINDVTLTNLDGSTARRVLASGNMSVLDPPDGIGRVDTGISVNAASDNDLGTQAAWKLWVSTVDDDRYPVIPFDMARPVTPDTVPLLDIGSYCQVTGTPPWVPPSPVRQIAAGFAEVLGQFGIWLIQVNGIPEAPYEVAVVGVARVAPAASELGSSISSTAASFTGGSSDSVWTQNSANYPADIVMAGERMTLTSVTGTSAPQTFHVTRSVNGVVKAQTAGTPFTLYQLPVAAL